MGPALNQFFFGCKRGGHHSAAGPCANAMQADRGEGDLDRPKSEGALRSGAAGRRGRRETPHRGATHDAGRPRASFLASVKRRAVFACSAILLGIGLAIVGLAVAVVRTSPDLTRADALSVTVLDRNDHLLRAFTTPDGLWRLPASVDSIDPRYLQMLIAYEDGRFYSHPGVDPVATLRAAGQLLRHGRIVSGASTLTMQVARLLAAREPRGLATKLDQALTALALERRLSKREILDLYLRLAPFGGNLEGVRAASLAYFGKEPLRLSVAERALLVAIPQSPAARRPDRSPNAARRARNRVLDRAAAAGVITQAEAQEARRAPVPRKRRPFPQLAPHLAEAWVAANPGAAEHRLTIDRVKQGQLERLAREHAIRLGAHLSAALIAIDHATGEVVSLVGSAGYLDAGRLGAIDMTEAVRSPGSTLKPFVYGLAFERGIAHPETHIEDRPARFGRYTPANFDQDFHGTVTVREALAMSLNIPAVKVLSEVGPLRLAARLNRAGGRLRLPDDAEPSLAIALGGAGLTLRDLATLYTALARGGEAIPLAYNRSDSSTTSPPRPVARLMSPVAAWYVGNILKGAPPPANAKGYRIAFKTGTSYGYRDAWAAGFDGRHVIVAWVGRPDGTATAGLTGHGSAAPLLFDAFARLSDRPVPLARAPDGVRRVSNSDLPLPLQRFNDGAQSGDGASVAIAFPPDKAMLETAREAAAKEEIVLKAEGGKLPLTWLVDGRPLESAPDSRQAVWQPTGTGFASISVVDAQGRADRVSIRLKPAQ